MNNYPKKYFQNLDALRFFAFLLVFIEHMVVTNGTNIKSSSLFIFYQTHFNLASVGVGFFITLSGFLISWIILEEYQHTSSFKLSSFWVRRCLRIWPLNFLMIIIGFILVAFAKYHYNTAIHDMPPLAYLLTFTLNFFMAQHGAPFLFFISFLWSISMEEQFYTLWGIVLKWGKKLFPFICFTLIAISIIFRIIFITDNNNLYFNSLNWIGDFAIGGLLAYYSINGKLDNLKNIPRPITLLIYFVFIVSLLFYNSIFSSTVMTIMERLIGSLFFIFILFEQSFSERPVFSLNKSKKLSYLGKISYGLFCYHGLVLLLFSKFIEHFGILNVPICVFLINPLITFALTIVLSALSYEYFEKPFMRLRYKIIPA